MKKAIDIMVIIVLIIIVDWVLYVIDLFSTHPVSYGVLFFLAISILMFLLINILTYKKFYDLNSSKIKIASFIICSLFISMFAANRLLDINKLYYYSKKRTNSSNLWKSDYFLAHRGIPNAEGYYEYSIGDSILGKIEVRFDSSGYRTISDNGVIFSDTLNLFLGCSFTFGDYIIAEDGFPYKTSKLLNHNLINAGVSAYGIGQMKQLVDSLLIQYKFNYVFIQLSPWLADRAMSLNGPTEYGYRPFPYFSEKGTGFSLNFPAYKTRKYNGINWTLKEKTYLEKIKHLFTEGIRIEILDFLSYWLSKIEMKLGIIPTPTNNKLELEKYFYSYAIHKVKEYGAIPILLKLKYPNEKCIELLKHIESEAKIIDLDVALDDVVRTSGQEYKTLFSIYHLHNGIRLYYDDHPNEYANSLISNYIFTNLKME